MSPLENTPQLRLIQHLQQNFGRINRHQDDTQAVQILDPAELGAYFALPETQAVLDPDVTQTFMAALDALCVADVIHGEALDTTDWNVFGVSPQDLELTRAQLSQGGDLKAFSQAIEREALPGLERLEGNLSDRIERERRLAAFDMPPIWGMAPGAMPFHPSGTGDAPALNAESDYYQNLLRYLYPESTIPGFTEPSAPPSDPIDGLPLLLTSPGGAVTAGQLRLEG